MKIYFDADPTAYPSIDDMTPLPAPAPAAPARRQRRKLQNWQKFLLCYLPCMAGGALILLDQAGLLVATIGLLIWSLTVMIIVVAANERGTL